MTESDLPPSFNRLSNNLFNQLVCFGKEYFINEQEAPALFASEGVSPNDIFAQHKLTSEQLIKLFIQTALLDAFLSQEFPKIFTNDPVKKLVNYWIDNIGTSGDIHPSTIIQTLAWLEESIEKFLQKLFPKIHQGQGVFKDRASIAECEVFINACQTFLGKLHKNFQSAQTVFMNLKEDMPLTKELIFHCLSFLHDRYEYGRSWAMHFFEYHILNYAPVELKRLTDQELYGLKMQTVSDNNGRYIELTISPCLSIEDFLNIPIYVFHEYISHLCAGIYLKLSENSQLMRKAIKSYLNIPDQIDEGWMVYAAQKFLIDRKYELLREDHHYLQYTLQESVYNWIVNMHDPYRGSKSYVPIAESGAIIADDFLALLRYDVCNRDEYKANILYYRISFDLITSDPDTNFNHLDFLISLRTLCRNDRSKLAQYVRESIDRDGEFINIELLWQSIRNSRPKPSLEIH